MLISRVNSCEEINMSKKSEAVKLWRKRSKDAIVEAMGGKCSICGYDKCQASLALHHIDPNEKEYSLGGLRATPRKWEIIVKELQKCALICSNCHGEIHQGLISDNKIKCTYNKKYIRSSFYPKSEQDNCPICGKLKPVRNITCSKNCAARKARRVNWDNIDVINLVENIQMSYCAIADMIGNISDASVRRRYLKLKNEKTNL